MGRLLLVLDASSKGSRSLDFLSERKKAKATEKKKRMMMVAAVAAMARTCQNNTWVVV
jgi:hypothetical protein